MGDGFYFLLNRGNKFIDNLARDIKSGFHETTGFSVRNLKYIRTHLDKTSLNVDSNTVYVRRGNLKIMNYG